jgi:endonuclease/exonuclease/phosphatase family metal-dependent hydrolase
MPPFPRPTFKWDYDVTQQIAALRTYRDSAPNRQIPAKASNRLLLATWNIANLGLQKRDPSDYRLIAEIVSWFDIVAIQEVNDDLTGILAIRDALPSNYKLLFSGAGGNRERQAFVYDQQRVTQLEEVGQLVIPPSQLPKIKLPGTKTSFPGFDRGPYLAAFQSGDFRFLLVNVHLFFGSTKPADMERRTLETYALAWWADQRRKDGHTYVPDMIPLGDFNLPQAEPGDPIYAALTKLGLQVPPHSSQIGSAIASDSHYDQIAFFPGDTQQHFTGAMNVFDWDGALFADLFKTHKLTDFHAYCRFHISDHRPLWAQFTTG